MSTHRAGFRRRVTALIAFACVVWLSPVFAASATSIRLQNKDPQTWKLYVKHHGSAVHSTIGPRTVTNICSKPCTIQVKDTGASISANPGDLIIIKGGRLSKKR
jgi:hypothetical protein